MMLVNIRNTGNFILEAWGYRVFSQPVLKRI